MHLSFEEQQLFWKFISHRRWDDTLVKGEDGLTYLVRQATRRKKKEILLFGPLPTDSVLELVAWTVRQFAKEDYFIKELKKVKAIKLINKEKEQQLVLKAK